MFVPLPWGCIAAVLALESWIGWGPEVVLEEQVKEWTLPLPDHLAPFLSGQGKQGATHSTSSSEGDGKRLPLPHPQRIRAPTRVAAGGADMCSLVLILLRSTYSVQNATYSTQVFTVT